jgi:colanic acid biosynthesis glycosyl transferase WcaI
MRILILSLQFPPDVNSNGMLMSQIAEDLTKRGHKVTVFTTFPHYERFRVWDQYRGKLAERRTYQQMRVLRLYVHARGSKQRFVNRFLSYFSFATLATLAGLLDRNKYDVVLCQNGGFLSGIAAGLIAAFRRIPFVLNVQDLYPETPIETGQIRNPVVIRMLRWLERWMYDRAAQIVVITPRFQSYLRGIGVPASKISVIPNFVDTDFIRPLPRENEFSARQSLLESFVVTHAGNIGLAYDLETLLQAAQRVSEHPEIQFLIVGDGVLRSALEQTAASLRLNNVRFLGFQPRDELPLLRAASDVQVALTRPGASNHSMPSKVYEIMASGRPLLASADPDSDLWNLVSHTQCGICVEPRDATRLADAIVAMYRDPPLRRAMGTRGRAAAEERYSRSAVAASYEDVLTRIAGS